MRKQEDCNPLSNLANLHRILKTWFIVMQRLEILLTDFPFELKDEPKFQSYAEPNQYKSNLRPTAVLLQTPNMHFLAET